VLCPNYSAFVSRDQRYRDYFVKKRDQGIDLEFYAAWPARLFDPYAGRLMAWTSWRYGATGIYIWSLGDTAGASSWNEYLTSGQPYAPMFIDEDSITAGKYLEAMREGVQDFEYFVMLDRAVQGMRGPEADEARRLLESLPVSVLEAAGQETHLLSQRDRTLADEARIQVLEALTSLKVMTAVEGEGEAVNPHEFRLEQGFPNPFNPSTTIEFSLPARGRVELAIYNLAGQQVRKLVSSVVDEGAHSIRWDGTDDGGSELATGVYLYRLQAGEQVSSRKLLLLR